MQDIVVVGGWRHVGGGCVVRGSTGRVSGRHRRCCRQAELRLVGCGYGGRRTDGSGNGGNRGHAVGATAHLAQLAVEVRVAHGVLWEARC